MPGSNFAKAAQWQADDEGAYAISPTKTAPNTSLPPENTGGTPAVAPFSSVSAAESVEPALPLSECFLLTVGGSGLPHGVVDTRISSGLPDCPLGLTDPTISSITCDDYTGSPVHRFFQMWQEADRNINAATPGNPSGCLKDLFPWVEVTVGAGSNGNPQPAGFNDESTREGSISMGFYNSAEGGVSYFTWLAHQYALSDNDSGYIQPIYSFGDGTRIPLLVVSPYSTSGSVLHTYHDHVSFDKFVEANRGLERISDWHRDNLPNRVVSEDDPYVPYEQPRHPGSDRRVRLRQPRKRRWTNQERKVDFHRRPPFRAPAGVFLLRSPPLATLLTDQKKGKFYLIRIRQIFACSG